MKHQMWFKCYVAGFSSPQSGSGWLSLDVKENCAQHQPQRAPLDWRGCSRFLLEAWDKRTNFIWAWIDNMIIVALCQFTLPGSWSSNFVAPCRAWPPNSFKFQHLVVRAADVESGIMSRLFPFVSSFLVFIFCCFLMSVHCTVAHATRRVILAHGVILIWRKCIS